MKDDFFVPLTPYCKCGHDASQHNNIDDDEYEGCTVCNCKNKWNEIWRKSLILYARMEYEK